MICGDGKAWDHVISFWFRHCSVRRAGPPEHSCWRNRECSRFRSPVISRSTQLQWAVATQSSKYRCNQQRILAKQELYTTPQGESSRRGGVNSGNNVTLLVYVQIKTINIKLRLLKNQPCDKLSQNEIKTVHQCGNLLMFQRLPNEEYRKPDLRNESDSFTFTFIFFLTGFSF